MFCVGSLPIWKMNGRRPMNIRGNAMSVAMSHGVWSVNVR